MGLQSDRRPRLATASRGGAPPRHRPALSTTGARYHPAVGFPVFVVAAVFLLLVSPMPLPVRVALVVGGFGVLSGVAWLQHRAGVIRYSMRRRDVIVRTGVFWRKETVQPNQADSARGAGARSREQAPRGPVHAPALDAGTGHVTFGSPTVSPLTPQRQSRPSSSTSRRAGGRRRGRGGQDRRRGRATRRSLTRVRSTGPVSAQDWRRLSPWAVLHFAARSIVENVHAAIFGGGVGTLGLARSNLAACVDAADRMPRLRAAPCGHRLPHLFLPASRRCGGGQARAAVQDAHEPPVRARGTSAESSIRSISGRSASSP